MKIPWHFYKSIKLRFCESEKGGKFDKQTFEDVNKYLWADERKNKFVWYKKYFWEF